MISPESTWYSWGVCVLGVGLRDEVKVMQFPNKAITCWCGSTVAGLLSGSVSISGKALGDCREVGSESN